MRDSESCFEQRRAVSVNVPASGPKANGAPLGPVGFGRLKEPRLCSA